MRLALLLSVAVRMAGAEPDPGDWLIGWRPPLVHSEHRQEGGTSARLTIDATRLVYRVVFTPGGERAFVLDRNGILIGIDVESRSRVARHDFGAPCTDLAMTKLGVAVAVNHEALCVVDPVTLAGVHRIPVPALESIAGSSGSAVVYGRLDRIMALQRGFTIRDQEPRHLWVVDLARGTVAAKLEASAYDAASKKAWEGIPRERQDLLRARPGMHSWGHLHVSPDGRAVFNDANGTLHAFAAAGVSLTYRTGSQAYASSPTPFSCGQALLAYADRLLSPADLRKPRAIVDQARLIVFGADPAVAFACTDGDVRRIRVDDGGAEARVALQPPAAGGPGEMLSTGTTASPGWPHAAAVDPRAQRLLVLSSTALHLVEFGSAR